ncbi:uncharacterized protein LOC134828403 [Culicoides brevitarsis]|uniref:uncharacterized protein LOC134828403 n=1 Tax=Culicoides brevitarsis TaxID=469753 RepID=UPI00307B894D
MVSITLREAGRYTADNLYGENSEISELQLLFSLTELYRMKKELKKIPGNTLFDEIVVNIEDVAKDLETEVDRQMPSPESPDYKKFLAMKAFSLNLRGSNAKKTTDSSEIDYHPEFCMKSVEILEEIRLEPVAVYFYVDALNTLGTCYLFKNPQKAVDYLSKAESTYNSFLKKVPDAKEAFTPYKLFDVPREIKTLWCLLMAHHYTSIFLFAAWSNVKNDSMKLKYAMPSIRAKISIDKSENQGIYVINNTMPAMVEEINCLIKNLHFAQVNHLLAGFMNNLVQYRRSLPEDERHKVDFAQSLVSLAYGSWAYELVHTSFLVLTDALELEETPEMSFYAFDDLMTGEYTTYEHQFSCELLQSVKKLKSAIRKGKQWTRRAADMGDKSHYANYAEALLAQFDVLEEDIKFLDEFQ